MFNTIVLGLDGSEGAKVAVPVASELAERYGARVVIVHVDERIPAKGGVHPVRADEEQVREDLDEQARAFTGGRPGAGQRDPAPAPHSAALGARGSAG